METRQVPLTLTVVIAVATFVLGALGSAAYMQWPGGESLESAPTTVPTPTPNTQFTTTPTPTTELHPLCQEKLRRIFGSAIPSTVTLTGSFSISYPGASGEPNQYAVYDQRTLEQIAVKISSKTKFTNSNGAGELVGNDVTATGTIDGPNCAIDADTIELIE